MGQVRAHVLALTKPLLTQAPFSHAGPCLAPGHENPGCGVSPRGAGAALADTSTPQGVQDWWIYPERFIGDHSGVQQLLCALNAD